MSTIIFFKRLTAIGKDILKQILIIFFYIVLTLILQLIFLKPIINTYSTNLNIVYILIELITLTSFIIIFRKKLVPDFFDFQKNGKNYLRENFYLYILGLVILLISNSLISYFIDISTNEELNREFLTKMPFYSILTMVIMAPIIEECLTRAILKDTFKISFIYYLLSGLIFGALHLLSATSIQELFFIIPYGALGFVFAIMYKKTNNIWTNIFFHSMHNLIAILVIFRGL